MIIVSKRLSHEEVNIFELICLTSNYLQDYYLIYVIKHIRISTRILLDFHTLWLTNTKWWDVKLMNQVHCRRKPQD